MLSLLVLALLVGANWSSVVSEAKQLGSDRSAISVETITNANQSALPSYILAGGQSGLWFTSTQYPELYKVSFANNEQVSVPLSTAPSSGTVWTGGWNGSDWLITGWGNGGSNGLNPYFDIYDNEAQTELSFSNYVQASAAEQEWSGGDIFSATWNGSIWLLTGMGSGDLANYGSTNHYSMGFLTSNGTFIDLSQSIPQNNDGILYASAWNGSDWLVGGGYYDYDRGVVYSVSPNGTISDITSLITKWVPDFNSVQSIAWNGTDWMIGGVHFLAEYNPSTGAVYDLTGALDTVLSTKDSLSNQQTNSVNSIVWDGMTWIIAGGIPVGFKGTEDQTAWVASFNPNSGQFSDLTSHAIPSLILSESSMSSILSMSCSDIGCALGGFAGNNPVLIWYDGSGAINLSDTITSDGMSYVQWVGVSDAVAPTISSVAHAPKPGPKILPLGVVQ
ncbi:MAG: hypothetical protein ABSE82_12780 [Nitrososphaerales archaeon]